MAHNILSRRSTKTDIRTQNEQNGGMMAMGKLVLSRIRASGLKVRKYGSSEQPSIYDDPELQEELEQINQENPIPDDVPSY